MVTVRSALGVVLAATAVSASTDELQLFARLLKRQEPGSPAYNCHDNCGQAIIQGRSSSDVCHDDIFLSDYKACLQCAGPDNQDIWQYYGGTLTKDATSCGLSTTPLSGKQPDVGPAVPASGGSSSTPQSTPSATSSATEAPSSESSAVVTKSAPSTTADASAPSIPVETGSGSDSATASATESASVTSAASTSYTPTGTSGASGSSNGTAPTSSGVVVVSSAGKVVSGSSFGFYGALALGAFYAVTQ